MPHRLLVRDQPERDLGVRVGRDDRLVAGAGVAAPHAVDLGGRAGPDALQRAEAGLAVRPPATRRSPATRCLVERQLGDQLALPVGQLDDVVVEAGDRARGRRRRAARASSRASAVSGLGTAPPNDPECRSTSGPWKSIWHVGQPAHAGAQRGTSAAHIAVSLTTTTSAPSRSAPLAQELGEVRRAGLLLALDEQLQVHRG